MKTFLIKDEAGTILHTVKLPGDGKIIVEEEDNSVIVPIIYNDEQNPFNGLLNGRVSGKFMGQAFWLHHKYNWELRKDSDNQLLLVPTKK